MLIRVITSLMLLLMVNAANALDATAAGEYAVVDREGRVTNKVFRVAQADGRWNLEDKKQNGTWESVTCQGDCVLRESSFSDIGRFFAQEDLGRMTPSCIHNIAFAFCSYVMRTGNIQPAYVFVVFTARGPIHVRLVRFVHES